MRPLILCVFAASGTAGPALAGAPAPLPDASRKFVQSEVVVTGKVTALEKDTVRATAPHTGAKDNVAYRVAVVKIDAALVGASGVTHIKVGFVPPDPKAPPVRGSGGVIRPPAPVPELKDGQTVLLYLCKHPAADFYVMPWQFMPADLGTVAGTQELDTAKTFAAALADPLKGLQSDARGVRAETAARLVAKYRAYPALGAKVEPVPIGADESRLILRGIAEGDWSPTRSGAAPAAVQALYALGLTAKDGWKVPIVKPGEDVFGKTQEAFARWLEGPGREYRVKRFAPKQ
ncbi:MAG TPA: hypothetical protein VGE74_00325 [Gemmata sp.]